MNTRHPFWQSGGWWAFVLTLASLDLATVLCAPGDPVIGEAIKSLALAVVIALPILIGGRAVIDHARVKAP